MPSTTPLTTPLNTLLAKCKVLPVVVVNDIELSIKLAQTLLKGGMPAIEVTLRTPHALQCITAIKHEVPELIVAAGTITNSTELAQATQAGADFCVSPGLTERLLDSAIQTGVQLLPGVASASDVMLGREMGLSLFKLFPAEACGGRALLKSLAGPFGDVKFCPTGGLNPDNYQDYLALDNVICVGGSWMVKESLVENQQWDEIEALAAAAVK